MATYEAGFNLGNSTCLELIGLVPTREAYGYTFYNLDTGTTVLHFKADKGYKFDTVAGSVEILSYSEFDRTSETTTVYDISSNSEYSDLVDFGIKFNIYTVEGGDTGREMFFHLENTVCTELADYTPIKSEGNYSVYSLPKDLFIFHFTPAENYVFAGEAGYVTILSTSAINRDTDVSCTYDIRTNSEFSYVDTNPPKFDFEAVYRPPALDTSFNNLYSLTKQNLSDLAKARFIKPMDNTTVDVGTFITSLYQLFLPVTDIIGAKSNIVLGYQETSINADTLNNFEKTYSFGTINIPAENSVYDYKGVQALAYIPFFYDSISLPLEYVIGQSVSIDYWVNLLEAKALVTFSSTFNKGIFMSKEIDIGNDIPFIQRNNKEVINNSPNVIYKTITNAYIEIVKPVKYTAASPYGKQVVDYVTLSDIKGYIEVDKVEVADDNATENDIQDIITLLQQGVIIN